MAQFVYILTCVIALSCGGLLLRGFSKSKSRLLFWSSICFFLLALENILLFADVVLLPDVDLRLLRGCVALAGMLALVYGLVGEKE